MLATSLILLLGAVAPLVLANPLDSQAEPLPLNVRLVTVYGPAVVITITDPATIPAPTAAALEVQQQPELRDLSPRDGFATSPATTTTEAEKHSTQVLDESATSAATTAASPTDDPAVDSALAAQGWTETTYYACETFASGADIHCGWHRPIGPYGAADGLRRQAMAGSPGLAAAGAVVCAVVLNAFLNW